MLRQAFVLGFLFFAVVTLAQQNQPAKCTNSTFARLANSQGEDPCTVGIKFGQICDPGFSIPVANSTQVYQPVRAGADTQCICSTVYFTLLTVCGACEGAETVLWPLYSENCGHSFVDEMPPVPLPSDLAIPHWALTPLSTNGSINPAAIEADTQPDITASTSSTTQSPSQTPSSPVTSSPTPSQSQAADNGGGGGGGGTNAGAIAGGVVGGVVGLAILAALAFFLRRHQNRKKANGSTEYGNVQTSAPPPGWVSPEQGSTLRSMSHYRDNSYGSDSPKLYNPDDPSTFPAPVTAPMSPTLLRPTSPGHQPTINSSFSAFPHTTDHGEWSQYRPMSAAPEI
ncbi:hypothetical protein VKT23_009384 [Stygiomarasmius scandens]|uniref:Epidermal growth factor receptor-like transmembrane-juxtamembrane segment domain-containing protein n=1 Tax=Marasmiellus scandens TaxID=2682957 RepID=A0ABR1JHV3_9AGAR